MVSEHLLCHDDVFLSLRTGLLKWNPDYHSAANHFEKAGMYIMLLCRYRVALFTGDL